MKTQKDYTYNFISTDEADEQYDITRQGMMFDYKEVVLFKQDILIEGDMYQWFKHLMEKEGKSTENTLIIIEGDLSVNGTIHLDYDYGSYPCLFLKGNLKCDAIRSTDEYILITGDADIKYVLEGIYNDGMIRIEGKTKVPYLVFDDHHIDIDLVTRVYEIDLYDPDLNEILEDEIIDNDTSFLIDTITDGKSPFIPGKEPEITIPSHEILSTLTEKDTELDLNLIFRKKKVSSIPIEILEHISLKKLDISHSAIDTLPKEIFNLINLEELHLDYTKITELPKEIGQLKKLKVLSLNNCKNIKIPDTLVSLTQIEELYFEGIAKDVAPFPEWIYSLVNLKILSIRNNRFDTITDEIKKLAKLEELDICDMILNHDTIDSFQFEKLKKFIHNRKKKAVVESEDQYAEEPTRPDHLPKAANWKGDTKEWYLGSVNEANQFVGEWKWWHEEGHLVCHTFFHEDNSQSCTYTRFHQDGTYSQKGSYEDGKVVGTQYCQRSENRTTERSMDGAPENIFRYELTYEDGEVIANKNYDKEGNELDQNGNMLNPKPVGNIPEDATWDAEYEEWEKGEVNSNGDRIGIWPIWYSDGNKKGNYSYDNDGELIESIAYHPDGSEAGIEKYYEEGVMSYLMKADSKNQTPHQFPSDELGEDVFKVEYLYDKHGNTECWKTFDEQGTLIENNEMYHSLDCQTPQTKFDSFADASKVWNEKNDTFYKDMNWWLSQYYEENHDVPEGTPEPLDTRQDMERVFLEAIEKFNTEGTPEKTREFFKPSVEPVSKYLWEKYGQTIEKVWAIDAATIFTKVYDNIYLIKEDKITLQEDVKCFGTSKNKEFIAKGYTDKIVVSKGLEGEEVATFSYPTQYNKKIYTAFAGLTTDAFDKVENIGIKELKVASDGKQLLVIAKEGIYLITKNTTEQLFPRYKKISKLVDNFTQKVNGDLQGYIFNLNISYPNADFSIDDSYIVTGGMLPSPTLSGTYIYKNNKGSVRRIKKAEEEEAFGIVNKFHTNGKDLLHAMCMYASINTNWSNDITNTTFRLETSQIEDGEKELDNFAGGYRQAPGMVLAACEIEDGFALGVNKGYIWWHGPDSSLQGYVHISGEITSIDITADKTHMVVANNQGQIVKYSFIDKKGTGMITNMNLKDEKRYLFLKTFNPLVW